MTSDKSYMSTNFLCKKGLFFSPRISQEYPRGRGGGNSCRPARLNQQADLKLPAFALQSPCPLPWGQHAGGLFDVFVTATVLHWTVLGCGVLSLLKAELTHNSRFTAALNSHWQQTDATLRRYAALCRVKFRKVKSCSKIWGTSATSVLKIILCIDSTYM